MIEGVHIIAPEAAVFLDTIPMLPNRGRALRDLVQPGRIILLEQQLICRIRMPVVA
ncbi:hypothetical protein D3C77_700580 [compost metagenome]